MSEFTPKYELKNNDRSEHEVHHERHVEKKVNTEKFDRNHNAEKAKIEQEQREIEARNVITKIAEDKQSFRKSIEKESSSSKTTFYGSSAELRKLAYERTISRIRNRMNPAEKALDTVIRQPGIEELSETGSKTIARPWPLLGGGLTATLGYVLAIFYARRYGFSLKPHLFLIFFGIGYLAALLLEVITRLIVRRNQPD